MLCCYSYLQHRFVVDMTIRFLAACAAALLLASAAAAARPASAVRISAPAVVTIPGLGPWLSVSGRPTRAAWSHAAHFRLDNEVQPGHNRAAPIRTDVYVGYGPQALWLRFLAFDPRPRDVRIHYRRRDGISGTGDDFVGLLFSPFNDTQWAYEFLCTAGGVEADAFRQQKQEYFSFNTIWGCSAHPTPRGYEVVMRIPFRSIKLPQSTHPQTWRLGLFRNWPRNLRRVVAQFRMNYNSNCLLCQTQVVRTATPITAKELNVQIIPALTVSRADTRPATDTAGPMQGTSQASGGLTARWMIRPDLEWAATLNPNFSEVEPTRLQLTVNQPFALFYPENRPFFEQGAWVFNTPFELVDTRQITNPHWATKLVGQIGVNAMDALIATDTMTNILLPGPEDSALQIFNFSTRDALLRYRYDLSNDSALGVLLTSRQGGGYHNQVLAFDTSWQLGPSDSITVQVGRSATAYPGEVADAFGIAAGSVSGNAWTARFRRTRKNYLISFGLSRLGSGFRADLGYLPQVGYLATTSRGEYNWYGPNNAWYQNLGLGGAARWVRMTGTGPILERRVQVYAFGDGGYQSHLFFSLSHEDRYFGGTSFTLNQIQLFAKTQPTDWFRGRVGITAGDGIDYTGIRKGKLLSIAPAVTLSPRAHFQLSLVTDFERLNITGGRLFTANLYDFRLAWYFNPRLFVRATIQEQDVRNNVALYPPGTASRTRNLASQWLLGYVLNPWTAFYAGFSNGYLETGNSGLLQQQRTYFLKFSYDFPL